MSHTITSLRQKCLRNSLWRCWTVWMASKQDYDDDLNWLLWLHREYFLPQISYQVQGQSIKKLKFFLNLLLYLQPNQTFQLQNTPLHSWYTAPNVFSSPATHPGTCFAGWRDGPISNFLLFPLLSEIGDLLVWISTWEQEKVCRGQIWRAGRLEDNSRLMLRQKFTDKEWRMSRCIVMVQHPGVCPHPGVFLRTASLKRFRTFR